MKCTLVFLALVTFSAGQIQQRYYNRVNTYSDNSGQYVHDNSGAYNADDGRYHPDNSGQYVHDGSGNYRDSIEKYRHQADQFGSGGSGGGYYSGSGSDSGYYSGSGNVGGAGGSSGKYGISSGLLIQGGALTTGGASRVSGFGIGSNSGSGVSVRPAGGYGPQVALKQGSAAGLYDNRNYGIIRKVEQVEEDGYHYLYETENGITGEEQGKLANKGTDAEAMQASGYYTYTGPDNVVYTVRYTANENGFIPEGEHIPTPPPIPAAISRALEYQKQAGIL